MSFHTEIAQPPSELRKGGRGEDGRTEAASGQISFRNYSLRQKIRYSLSLITSVAEPRMNQNLSPSSVPSTWK